MERKQSKEENAHPRKCLNTVNMVLMYLEGAVDLATFCIQFYVKIKFSIGNGLGTNVHLHTSREHSAVLWHCLSHRL